MQSNSQESKPRTDSVLEKGMIYKLDKNKWFIDRNWETVVNGHERFSFLNFINQNSFLKDHFRDYLQIYDQGTLFYLSGFKLGDAERSHIDKNGLEIYLTEQIFNVKSPKQEINLDGKTKIDLDILDDSHDIWSPELDSVQDFVELNQLNNVTVFVSFEDPKSIYKDKYSFSIERVDPFLEAMRNQMLGLERNFINFYIDKKFWCGNNRYTPTRHLITSFVSRLDTEYSWCFTDPEHLVLENIWFNINDFKYKHDVIEGIYHLNENPRGIDATSETVQITGTIEDHALHGDAFGAAGPLFEQYTSADLYKNAFCAIINYSSFDEPFPSYDEKVLSAMLNQRPFIFCGPPGSLALMRKDGFRTFSDFWDESYDEEWDHTKRLEKIFDLIAEINSWSIDKCKDMYAQMLETIYWNYMKIKDGK